METEELQKKMEKVLTHLMNFLEESRGSLFYLLRWAAGIFRKKNIMGGRDEKVFIHL